MRPCPARQSWLCYILHVDLLHGGAARFKGRLLPRDLGTCVFVLKGRHWLGANLILCQHPASGVCVSYGVLLTYTNQWCVCVIRCLSSKAVVASYVLRMLMVCMVALTAFMAGCLQGTRAECWWSRQCSEAFATKADAC